LLLLCSATAARQGEAQGASVTAARAKRIKNVCLTKSITGIPNIDIDGRGFGRAFIFFAARVSVYRRLQQDSLFISCSLISMFIIHFICYNILLTLQIKSLEN
jgi:hypothetical protein